MEDNRKTIEIKGTKFDVDFRTAVKIEELKIGDAVKILTKGYQSYDVLAGTIIDFINFEKLPTIQLVVFKSGYSGYELQFINYNAETPDMEIVPCSKHELLFEKKDVLAAIDQEIFKKEEEINKLKLKKSYFLTHFNKHFKQIEE